MNITYCKGYEAMSEMAASVVTREIENRHDLLLCAATGHSPAGVYAQLAGQGAKDPAFFGALRVVKLDEWGGLPENHPATGEHYLRTRLVDPLRIAPERYLSFRSAPPDPVAECARIRAALDAGGPIDLCILGLGSNGHLGFNEPAAGLEPHCHVARLSETSRGHTMVEALSDKPAFGLTLGMRDILLAGRIILLVWGANKAEPLRALLSGQITTQLPASLLWLHPRVDCIVGLP
ncbi:MAG: 6-phosphogluconolactonase [Cytophagales bacterium]|nr:6-phosphogluconolactonase [Cytophagales bacterium]